MMYTLKTSYAVLMLLLFTRTYGDLFRHAEQPQQYNPDDIVDTIPSLPWYLTSTQEIVLHDIILKSIFPQSFDIKAIQKRPLDASFYSGPIAATYSSDGVISQGNVYRLLNGHWMLCENGCVDCEPCTTQGNPLFKWILQNVKQSSGSDPLRHDFQLTIILKTNNPFHTNNLWPNNSNHVISETERNSILVTKTKQDNGSENSLPNHENSLSQPNYRSKDLWLTERDSISQEENHIQGNASTDKPLEQKYRLRNMKYRLRPVEKSAEEANQLAPKLILGTDQWGQKHLIHVVPANHLPINTSHFANLLAPNHSISSHFVADQASRLNNTISKHEKQTYQRIFRRVFDSLNTHRQSIESFLKSPNNVSEQRIASSMDNMDVAEFPWHRNINHTNANFESFRLNETLLLPFYATNNDEIEKNQQHRNNHGYQYIKPHVNNYYGHANRNQSKISRGQIQLPINFGFDREWRKALFRPYYINNKNISKINSSILSQSSDNSSIDAIPKLGFNNNLVVINSAKQIDPNETFIDKANNDFIEPSSIIIKRENERAFNSERLPSGDANREFETLRHAFRIITTDSPVIQRGHEILNRTTAL